jgi:MFS family permease
VSEAERAAGTESHAAPTEEIADGDITPYQWWVVILLTLAGTLSFIDRQILNVMIGPIKRDLGGLSDTEISLIIGLAFSLIYTLATIPMARMADRYNRRNIIAAGIFSWSLMTALAGGANTYWKLFIARMGVGVGEATLGPSSMSLLADTFARSRLPLAFGIVGAAPFIGTGLANILGGPLIDWLEMQPKFVWPVVGELFSWQVVLVIVGLPGVLLAALMFTISEPVRRGVSADDAAGYPMSEVWAFVRSRGRYLAFHFIGYLCLSIQGFALMTWVIELFVRKYAWTKTEIGLTYGFIALIVGLSGSIWSGWFAGRLVARGGADAPMRVAFWCTLCLGPIAVVMPLWSDGIMAALFLVPLTFFMSMPSGLSNAALAAIAPNRMRGQLIAAYLICVSFLSYLLAPLIIGLTNDYVFGREDAIDISIASLATINYTIAAICLGLSLRPLREAISRLATGK